MEEKDNREEGNRSGIDDSGMIQRKRGREKYVTRREKGKEGKWMLLLKMPRKI